MGRNQFSSLAGMSRNMALQVGGGWRRPSNSLWSGLGAGSVKKGIFLLAWGVGSHWLAPAVGSDCCALGFRVVLFAQPVFSFFSNGGLLCQRIEADNNLIVDLEQMLFVAELPLLTHLNLQGNAMQATSPKPLY